MEPIAARTEWSRVAPGVITALLGQLAHYDEAAPATPAVAPGSTVGRFEVLDEIGRGGFGVVYEARDPVLGRPVALKLLRPNRLRDAVGAHGLVEEAEAAAQLQHPNVVSIHELGEHDGAPYLVLELLKGETLENRLRAGPLPLRDALAIATEVTKAVAHAHARGVVHRDLKPGNVFLCGDGGVKVLDFGLSVFTGAVAPGTSGSKDGGTPAYMSPERLAGERGGAQSDVFAIGVMLHEMLTGERPGAPARDGGDATSRHARRPRATRRVLREVAARAISPDPSARPQDGAALLRLLSRAASAQDGSRTRRRRLLALAALAVTSAALGPYAWRAYTAPPREPIRIAVADVANESGASDMDAISTLLETALEPSRRLRAIPRARALRDAQRASGEDLTRLDAAALLAHRGSIPAQLALVPAARREGSGFVIIIRALDLASGRERFQVEARAGGPEDVMAAVEQLSILVRRRLREPEAEIRSASMRLAEVTTSNIAAFARFREGVQCFEASGTPEAGCFALLEKAVALDPAFPLAQAEVAMRSLWMGYPLEDVQAAMARALRHSNRLPPAQRLKLMAFSADLDGRESDAAALYQQAAAAAPDDRQLHVRAADFFLTRDEPDLALPFWEHVREADRAPTDAAMYVAFTLGALRRDDDLAALARHLEGDEENAAGLIALGFARSMLGDTAGAVAAGGAAISAATSDAERQEATRWHLHFRMRSHDLAMEPELRASCLRGTLRLLLGLAGRRREMVALTGPTALRGCPAPDAKVTDRDFGVQSFIARELSGAGRPDQAWPFARRAAELNPRLGANLATFLAYDGDLEHARRLAAQLYPGSRRQQIYEAVVLWRSGDREAARSRLRTLHERNPWSAPPPTLPASFLYGELLTELGDDAGAIEALKTFQKLDHPIEDFWTWAYPKSLYLTARSQERLGRTAEARATIQELLALWAHADPDLPLLADARALRARLERASR